MQTDHLNLLCNVNELSALLAGSADIDTFLARTVEMVADHIRADVCSIYMYDEAREELYLKATKGLNSELVGSVRLRLGEGLVGLCLANHRPICEQRASGNPHFKPIEGLEEEAFESFLAVPIQRGSEQIGVLVLQRREEDHFEENDVLAVQATASQLAGAIENARILLSLHEQMVSTGEEESGAMELVKGKSAVEGFAHARAVIHGRSRRDWQTLPETNPQQYTLEDFEAALSATESQLEDLEARLEKKLPEAASMIFGAHMMIIRDPEFSGAMRNMIRDGMNASEALRRVAQRYIDIFTKSPNAYIREKVSDVEDLARRLAANLIDCGHDPIPECQGQIVIAPDLFPSEVMRLASNGVAGIIVASGGVTSHIAILGRSLQIPLIIANNPRLLELGPDTDILMDAGVGNIYINPGAEVIDRFVQRNRQWDGLTTVELHNRTHLASGQRVRLMANINLLSDAKLAREMQAEGVGLYRTEFPFLIRNDFPSEAEQINIYHHLIEAMDGRQVTFRTLDIGGDKVLSYFPGHARQANPVLGMRSVRFSLAYLDIFREQLRAILRAAAGHENIRIMFPMISSVDEFSQAKAEFENCRRELTTEGLPHQPNVKVGMMVEIPSVTELMDEFADLADFFCIGTNDFIQFMLAVDRGNEKVAHYYQPQHPSVARALLRIVSSAVAKGKDISVCGEMAHEPLFIPFLLGIGVTRLSVDAHFLPAIQELISGLNLDDCRSLAADLLTRPSANAVMDGLMSFASSMA